MARLTMRRGDRPTGATSTETDQDDGALDEWFTRRLESQGIPAGSAQRPPLARMLAVGGLVVALAAVVWALSATSSGGNASPTTPVSTPPQTTPAPATSQSGNGGKPNGTPSATGTWNTIPLDVLNGSSISGAAASMATTLTQQGWKVAKVTNAGPTDITKTVVVFAPGSWLQARKVADRLKLTWPPQKLARISGISPNATKGVALVLGNDGWVPTAP